MTRPFPVLLVPENPDVDATLRNKRVIPLLPVGPIIPHVQIERILLHLPDVSVFHTSQDRNRNCASGHPENPPRTENTEREVRDPAGSYSRSVL
jgi:hypothetical protein